MVDGDQPDASILTAMHQQVPFVPVQVEQARIEQPNTMDIILVEQRTANVFRCGIMLNERLQRPEVANDSARVVQLDADADRFGARDARPLVVVDEVCGTLLKNSVADDDTVLDGRRRSYALACHDAADDG